MAKRYSVLEEMNRSLTTVLETDDLAEAKAKYATCWGAGRGAGGIIDNQLRAAGAYPWVA